MIKELFKFRKEDLLMWGGVGVFSLVMLAVLSLVSANGALVFKDLVGMVVVLLLPGYIIVKLYLDNFQVSENMTKNPDVNKAIDKLILSIGAGVISIIPLNFIWNYLLTMGGGEDQKGNLWGNVDEEMIYSGNASWRALFTVILVVGIALGVKIFQMKKNRQV